MRSQEMGQGGNAKAGGGLPEKVASIGEELGFEKRLHELFAGQGFVGVEEGEDGRCECRLNRGSNFL